MKFIFLVIFLSVSLFSLSQESNIKYAILIERVKKLSLNKNISSYDEKKLSTRYIELIKSNITIEKKIDITFLILYLFKENVEVIRNVFQHELLDENRLSKNYNIVIIPFLLCSYCSDSLDVYLKKLDKSKLVKVCKGLSPPYDQFYKWYIPFLFSSSNNASSDLYLYYNLENKVIKSVYFKTKFPFLQ